MPQFQCSRVFILSNTLPKYSNFAAIRIDFVKNFEAFDRFINNWHYGHCASSTTQNVALDFLVKFEALTLIN